MPLHPLNESQIALLEEYRSSGMTILGFARYKGISKYSIYHLIDKDRRLKAESLSNETITASNFIPVPIKAKELLIESSPNNTNSLISFNLNGLSISISKDNLKAFLEVLSQ